MIDIHCHILPGIDDGARNMKEAVEMAEMMWQEGIDTIVATPHSRSGSWEKLKTDTLKLTDELQRELRQLGLEMRVFPGCEILYSSRTIDDLREGRVLTLAGSRYALIEFPIETKGEFIYQQLRKIRLSGHIPVLAHVERYPDLRKDQILEDILETGCLTQMNWSSLGGSIFSPDRGWCRRAALEGMIHIMATDAHRKDWRPPSISSELGWLKKKGEGSLVENITRIQPEKIIKAAKER